MGIKLKKSRETFINKRSSLDDVKRILKLSGDLKDIGFYVITLNSDQGPIKLPAHIFYQESEKFPDTPYLILYEYNGKYFKIGKSKKEFGKMRYQMAVQCLECETVVYSMDRHDAESCGCPNDAMADGGQEYLRMGATDMNKIKAVTLDILTGKLKKERKNGRKNLCKKSSKGTGKRTSIKNG